MSHHTEEHEPEPRGRAIGLQREPTEQDESEDSDLDDVVRRFDRLIDLTEQLVEQNK